jgi:threonine/homoserine/homoserine lactone efflux protein
MTFTPGPNNIMSMNNAKNVGFKKAVKFNFGILVGSLFALGLCLLFSSILYNLVPKIQFPMKILGAAYLLYLVIKTLFSSKEHKTINTNGSFVIGIVLQLINPKLILFGITVMSSYVLPYYKEIPMQILLLFIIAIIGFTATLCWALSGSLFSILFFKHKKVLDIIMALLLLYCAISLFL